MYLVKIGAFAENSRKSMDKVLFFRCFPYFGFVVFYQHPSR